MNFFTSESVTEGHPDKICDQISDAILDAHLEQDSESRVACETAVTKDYVLVFGEITSKAKVNIKKVVKDTIKHIGYDNDALGFNYKTVKIDVRINKQSPDIARGVNEKEDHEQGAGDQGIMFGYANKETENYMPIAIDLAHKLAERLTQVRKENIIKNLRPDGKSQVTVAYENNKYQYIDTVVISAQHGKTWIKKQDELKKQIIEHVINPILKDFYTKKTKYLINPTGQFLQGGAAADAGLTGRKIIVDTYGGFAKHGGGAFSGKDASKVDRSAAYMARYLAKNIVASGIAEECEIQLAYAIGVAEPVGLYIDCNNTELVKIDLIKETIKKHFKLTPKAIINKLDLLKPRYKKTAAYGHFGKNDHTWEALGSIVIFKKLLYN